MKFLHNFWIGDSTSAPNLPAVCLNGHLPATVLQSVLDKIIRKCDADHFLVLFQYRFVDVQWIRRSRHKCLKFVKHVHLTSFRHGRICLWQKNLKPTETYGAVYGSRVLSSGCEIIGPLTLVAWGDVSTTLR